MKRPNLNLHREVLAELTTNELTEIAGAAAGVGASRGLPTLYTCACGATNTCACTATNTCGCGATNTCACGVTSTCHDGGGGGC